MNIKRKLFIATLILGLSSALSLYAQTTQLLNYQGKLANKDSTPASGTFVMIFSIYSQAEGGKALWDETQNVTVANGIFNVLLGSVKSFADTLFTTQGNRYLGIRVGTDPEMQPRFQLTSVAYAIHSSSATTLSAAPVVARWYATNDAETGPYKWGKELFNTNPSYLIVTPDGNQIEVKHPGYYMVCVNVLQYGLTSGERGNVNLFRNSDRIGASLGYGGTGSVGQYYKHIFNVIEYFQKGDKISVHCADHKIYATPDAWSSLEIYKLN